MALAWTLFSASSLFFLVLVLKKTLRKLNGDSLSPHYHILYYCHGSDYLEFLI